MDLIKIGTSIIYRTHKGKVIAYLNGGGTFFYYVIEFDTFGHSGNGAMSDWIDENGYKASHKYKATKNYYYLKKEEIDMDSAFDCKEIEDL